MDRTVGLAELERAASNTTFRAPFCSSFLLLYYTVVSVFTGGCVVGRYVGRSLGKWVGRSLVGRSLVGG